MRVVRKNFLHKILRPFLNWWGRTKGISGCLICGDNWSWKKKHQIKIKPNTSAFPICEECWQIAPDHLIQQASHELATRWLSQAPTYFIEETLSDGLLLKKNTKIELKNRGNLP